MVQKYYTKHHNEALGITHQKHMRPPQPKDTSYILPKMDLPHLQIHKEETNPDKDILPHINTTIHISKAEAHIHSPTGKHIGSISHPRLSWLCNNTIHPPHQLTYNPQNNPSTQKSYGYSKDTSPTPPLDPQ